MVGQMSRGSGNGSPKLAERVGFEVVRDLPVMRSH